MKYIIQYNRGGNSGPFYVGENLQEVNSEAEAKLWDYDDAQAFVNDPGFAAKYGQYRGILYADHGVRRAMDEIGQAIARGQGR